MDIARFMSGVFKENADTGNFTIEKLGGRYVVTYQIGQSGFYVVEGEGATLGAAFAQLEKNIEKEDQKRLDNERMPHHGLHTWS